MCIANNTYWSMHWSLWSMSVEWRGTPPWIQLTGGVHQLCLSEQTKIANLAPSWVSAANPKLKPASGLWFLIWSWWGGWCRMSTGSSLYARISECWVGTHGECRDILVMDGRVDHCWHLGTLWRQLQIESGHMHADTSVWTPWLCVCYMCLLREIQIVLHSFPFGVYDLNLELWTTMYVQTNLHIRQLWS